MSDAITRQNEWTFTKSSRLVTSLFCKVNVSCSPCNCVSKPWHISLPRLKQLILCKRVYVYWTVFLAAHKIFSALSLWLLPQDFTAICELLTASLCLIYHWWWSELQQTAEMCFCESWLWSSVWSSCCVTCSRFWKPTRWTGNTSCASSPPCWFTTPMPSPAWEVN